MGATATKHSQNKSSEPEQKHSTNRVQQPMLYGPHADILKLQQKIGNQAFIQLWRSRLDSPSSDSKGVPLIGDVLRAPRQPLLTPEITPFVPNFSSVAVIARNDSTEERQARAVSARARIVPTARAPLTSDESTDGVKVLSDLGRGYFKPLVGTAVDRARLHVGPRADRLAHLARAKALTYGNNVFIPRVRFSPESVEGRALLGHELAHVAQSQPGQPQLFRQSEIEPHYPTEAEQREIEKILSRDLEETEANGRGRSLNQEQRKQLAERLQPHFYATLDSLDTGESASSRGSALSEAEAFKVAQNAREAIYERFGDYVSRTISLTQDQTKTAGERRAANQVLVTSVAPPGIVDSVAITTIYTHCSQCSKELAGLDDNSRQAVVNVLLLAARRDRSKQLQRLAQLRVGGSYNKSEERIYLSLTSQERLYGTAVHELIHALVHPSFWAAFRDERHIIEGFTEYFTRQVVTSSRGAYAEPFTKVSRVRGAVSEPFLFPIRGASAEESLRLTYFRGRLELIGWRPSSPEEQEAVEKAGGSAEWDAQVARRYSATYRNQAQAAQGASRNVLGVGVYFSRHSAKDPTIAVRYARVLVQTEPYARGQLLLEGQLLGSPIRNPRTLGASIGIAGEYQEPYFYAGGGVRFVGTAAPTSGTNRLDLSPFVGTGVRAWQRIRVGAEGFLLLPLTGQEIQIGGGVTLGIEFD